MTVTIILFGLVASLAEVLGGWLVVMRADWPKRVQEYLLALGAGFILALVFVELVPEGLHAAGPAAPLQHVDSDRTVYSCVLRRLYDLGGHAI